MDACPGPVRDEIAKARSDWTRYVERVLDAGRHAVGFRAGADPAEVPQLAFEFIALMELANAHSVLHDDPSAYERAGRRDDFRVGQYAPVPHPGGLDEAGLGAVGDGEGAGLVRGGGRRRPCRG
ncbi:TetR family transcriptional regulator C-terminal domain-containing protein [Streptomyces xanthophaeus]|uniref:TetR family transcriptional regulator C-terminal domain-containing protein n=1 Tax=Streptomyces xanthophaeus TaxID=67385 RepID=UPI003683C4D1